MTLSETLGIMSTVADILSIKKSSLSSVWHNDFQCKSVCFSHMQVSERGYERCDSLIVAFVINLL